MGALGLLLCCGASLGAEVSRLAAPGLSYVNLDEKAGDAFLDYFTQQLALKTGLPVTTKAEIAGLLGLDRQRQMMSCGNEGSSSCVAEIGGALGADALIVGSLAKTTGGYVVNIKVVSTTGGGTLGIYSNRAPSDDALFDYLGTAAAQLAGVLRPGHAPTSLGLRTRESTGRLDWILPAGAGAAFAGAGVVFYALASSSADQLRNASASLTPAQFDQLRSDGQARQSIAFGLGGAGLAGLAAGGTMLALQPERHVRKRWAWLPAAGGAASLIAGGIFYGLAKGAEARLKSPDGLTPSDFQSARATGESDEAVAGGLLGLGLGGLAVATDFWLLGSGAEPSGVSVIPLRSGGAVILQGVFP